MPCITPLAYGRTLEFGWVTELLKEVSGENAWYDQIDYNYYGADASNLDELTEQLCRKCRSLGDEKIGTMSLQLQYWWMRHKMHDALREFRTKHGLLRTPLPEGF